MKLNIFLISASKVSELKEKLEEVKMEIINSAEIGGWSTTFFFSRTPDPVTIPWINHYPAIFNNEGVPTNKIHYGAYLWEKDGVCFALSYGKSHFYLRQFAQSDFGLQMATRVANKDDVTQKAARKFAGKKKREVQSYTKDSTIDIESGESVDFIQSAIVSEYQDRFGKTGKFGTSLLLTPEINTTQIPDVFDNIHLTMAESPKFKLPKIEIIRDDQRVATYDSRLISQIRSVNPNTAFSDETHYLVGIDFVFPSNQKYTLKFNHQESDDYESIDIYKLKSFINDHSIGDADILNIKVKITQDDARPYMRTLKQSLDFTLDDERVMLADGEWKEFNEDYLDQLHAYIDEVIIIDNTMEDVLKEINVVELEFNASTQSYGYSLTDKNFNILGLPDHTVEAWDLKKDKTVYAVKFGTPQKLGYVCDQAVNTLEILRNTPVSISSLDFDTYCLWLGIKRSIPERLSEISSIIFKQKLESWARKCRDMGITPKVRISKKI